MSVQDQYLAYVLEQLAGLGSLRSNRMFGGIGLYSREIFFGLIDDDTLFFKTDESNIAPYRDRNMSRFMPFPDRPEAVLGYHQVPADVIEDAEQLVEWARKSVQVALRRQVEKSTRKRTSVSRAKTAKTPAKKAARNPAKRLVRPKRSSREQAGSRAKKKTSARRSK
jgi:DNA transformation protein